MAKEMKEVTLSCKHCGESKRFLVPEEEERVPLDPNTKADIKAWVEQHYGKPVKGRRRSCKKIN